MNGDLRGTHMVNKTKMKLKKPKKTDKNKKIPSLSKEQNRKLLASEKAKLRKEKEYEKLSLLLYNFLAAEISEDCPVILNTSISELQGMNFSDRERECMMAVLNAEKINAPILSGSVKLRYRIELAAALLSLVVTKAHTVCDINRISKPNAFVDMLIGIIGKRAKEIMTQRLS